MNLLLLNAFVLGLIGGFIPGPVLTVIFTEILQGGFVKSIKIILFAFIAETVVAIFSLVFFASMGFSEEVFKSISIIGAIILLWIAVSLWKIKSIDSGRKVSFSFEKIVLLILANGMLWTYWITVCIPKAIELGTIVKYGEYVFVGLVEIGWLLTTFFSAVIFSKFRNLLSKPKVIPIMFKFFSGVFIYFALAMIYDSIVFFVLN